MFENFYGLSGKPFSLLPDSTFLFMSRRHSKAINMLDYGLMSQAGFIVITGDVGAGKTTIIRRFLKNVDPNVVVGVITNPSASTGKLLTWVAAAFELPTNQPSDAAYYDAFVTFLISQYSIGKRTVLIIDEAQNLTAEILEELRMLSNVNNEKDQLLQIVLVGQPELLDILNQPNLRQFAQRIAVHCHLSALTAAETAAYIRHRLSVVGGAEDIFTDTACAAIYYFTGGVPRLINLLCEQAMVYGFSEDQRHIGYQTVAEVVIDRTSSGLSAFKEMPIGWTSTTLFVALQPVLDEIGLSKKAEVGK